MNVHKAFGFFLLVNIVIPVSAQCQSEGTLNVPYDYPPLVQDSESEYCLADGSQLANDLAELIALLNEEPMTSPPSVQDESCEACEGAYSMLESDTRMNDIQAESEDEADEVFCMLAEDGGDAEEKDLVADNKK